MGGKVGMESKRRGSKFWIELASAKLIHDTKRNAILLVEDDEHDVFFFRRALQRQNCNSLAFGRGWRTGVQYLKRRRTI